MFISNYFLVISRFGCFIMAILLMLNVSAQELYVFTNPASNIPAKAIVAKASAKSMISYHNKEREFRFSPELQVGLSKKIMAAGSVSFSNMFFGTQQQFESARLYTKYRFFSKDEVHQHFRMAAFATGSWSRNELVYQEINLDGDNSGFQLGLVATQLIHKFAASAGVSYVTQLETKDKRPLGFPFSNRAIQYNLSTGYLLLPFQYKNYKQLNVNLYCELLGQQSTDIKSGFIDMAPAVQFIFKSSTRVNFGSRFQLRGNAHRMANQSLFVSLEHYFLNALK
jgi:hypothetical protein